MKKTKIKQIPHFPTKVYTPDDGWVFNGTLSHANYAGEKDWAPNPDNSGGSIYVEPTMVDNIPWDDELIYDGWYRGRSAAGLVFTNSKGQKFTIFMKDIDSFIPLMVNGKIKHKFIYCKRGANYGVTLYTGE